MPSKKNGCSVGWLAGRLKETESIQDLCLVQFSSDSPHRSHQIANGFPHKRNTHKLIQPENVLMLVENVIATDAAAATPKTQIQ